MNGILVVSWALVHFLWQGAIAGLAAAGLLSLLKNGRATIRYAIAAGFLLLMAALPIATAVRLAGSPATGSTFVEATFRQTSASSPDGSGGRLGEEGRGDEGLSAAIPFPVLPWVFSLWLTGVAVLSVYHLGGWRVARRLSCQGRAPGERLELMVRDLCRRLRIERAVILLESATVSVPSVIGVLRPVLLVPASTLAGLSPRQLEAILAHELAHVRRHDYLVNLFQTAIETLLFYHPAVWWVSAQVRRERESCCDDLAVAVCGDRLGYARALADLEGLRSARPRLALAADGGSLVDRIRRLVGAPARRSARRSWAAGLLALALLPAGAAIQLACSRGTASRPESRQAAPAPRFAGTWTGKLHGDQIRLEVKMRVGLMSHWTLMHTVPVSRLSGFSAGPNARFDLGHDAGTFHFQGSFVDDQGQGTATFSPNPEFARLIGVPLGSAGLLELSAHDVTMGYAREMKELGYVAYPREKRGVHGAMIGFVHDMLGRRDSSVDRLDELKLNGITPDYIRAMKAAGYPDLGPWELIDLRDHNVDPAWVQALHDAGYGPIPAFRLVELRSHDVDAEWLRGIVKAGYANLDAGDLVELRVQGVDGDFIRRAVSQSGRPLRVPEILALHARGGISS